MVSVCGQILKMLLLHTFFFKYLNEFARISTLKNPNHKKKHYCFNLSVELQKLSSNGIPSFTVLLIGFTKFGVIWAPVSLLVQAPALNPVKARLKFYFSIYLQSAYSWNISPIRHNLRFTSVTTIEGHDNLPIISPLIP